MEVVMVEGAPFVSIKLSTLLLGLFAADRP